MKFWNYDADARVHYLQDETGHLFPVSIIKDSDAPVFPWTVYADGCPLAINFRNLRDAQQFAELFADDKVVLG